MAGDAEDQSAVLPFLERFASFIQPGRTVLDVGCGTGVPADTYLVQQGLAINGIDASPENVERARENVPGGFFEIRDVLDLGPDEYCVDGVVSLTAPTRIPRRRYPALFAAFASYMPEGGPILVGLSPIETSDAGADSAQPAPDNEELVEAAGFTIEGAAYEGSGSDARQLILARR